MFKMGSIVITWGINNNLDSHKFRKDVAAALHRFSRADWGEEDAEDIEANNIALRTGDRLMGAYQTSKGKIWIITEADRSATTILFPDEY